jgi:hypothetical protein
VTTMTPGLESYLRALDDGQRANLAADSIEALRTAWPHRNADRRARIAVRSNVAMLRNLASLEGAES